MKLGIFCNNDRVGQKQITIITFELRVNISNIFGDSNSKSDSNNGIFGIENKKKQVCIKPTIINLKDLK